MNHAIIVASGAGIDGEDLSAFGRMFYCGNPQLTRLIIIAQRAGIEKFTVIDDGLDLYLRQSIEKDKRITAEINWQSPTEPLDLDSSPHLILQSNIVTTPSALENIIKSNPSSDEVMALVDSAKGALIKSNGNKAEELFHSGGKIVGVFAARGYVISNAFSRSNSLKSFLSSAIGEGKLNCLDFKDGYWMRLTEDEESLKRAEDIMFSHVSKSSSGWISKNIHSKLSIPVSRLLVKTPLTPNMISAIIGCIGALCGVFYAIGHPILGALFLEIATIFDRSDGEVARIKLQETKYGPWVDTTFDQLSFMSFVIGVPLGYWLIAHSKMAVIGGAINIGIFLFFLVWTYYFLITHAHSGTMVAYSKEVDKLIPKSRRTLLHRFIIKLRPMFKREFFSFVFLVAAIAGGYPWVLWLITLGLVLSLIHQVDDIIKVSMTKKRTKGVYVAPPQKQEIIV